MKIIAKPKNEEEVLLPVMKDAKADEVIENMITKAECCVDHLCGCS